MTSSPKFNIKINNERNKLLSTSSHATLVDRYLLKGETFQDLCVRIASYYADNKSHAQRLYDYMSQHWFLPATPILSNGGTNRGLAISCFVNEVEDSLHGIVNTWIENVWLASRGGGIGSYWGNVRAINEKIGENGYSSGIIPFIKVQDTMTLAISQGSLRRGSAAVYLPISHPEIEEFIDIRRHTGGDSNRKSLNIHHGIVISDQFMHAVEKNESWNLISPYDNRIINTVKARDLWAKLLTTRIETGEPYILFIDTVNQSLPEHHQKLGLKVKTSNLCSEITLPTGRDYTNNIRTAVCCLSSLNLEYFGLWQSNEHFIPDIIRFLDNVLEDFINKAPNTMSNAKYSAMHERSIGLGVMGFHSLLQANNIPIASVMAKVWNKKIFEHIKLQTDNMSVVLAKERGACIDAQKCNIQERFSYKTAIAPTASISIIANNASPGIEPYAANSFTQKTLTGSFSIKNKNLEKLLESKGLNNDQVWSSIATHEGSVQHLTFLSDHEKEVYKTAYEIDQRWLIELAADRTQYISQSQSLNIFLPGNCSKQLLHDIHFDAWKKNIKSLYYCRSTSIQRAEKVSHVVTTDELAKLTDKEQQLATSNTDDECLACQ